MIYSYVLPVLFLLVGWYCTYEVVQWRRNWGTIKVSTIICAIIFTILGLVWLLAAMWVFTTEYTSFLTDPEAGKNLIDWFMGIFNGGASEATTGATS